MPAISDDWTLPRCWSVADQAVQSGDQAERAQSLTAVARGERLVEAAGVFSANEEADDVQTNDLRYLLLPFFQGELLAAAQEARQLRLRQALAAYDRYWRCCKRLRLSPDWLTMPGAGTASPDMLRQQKVARFRASKQLREAVRTGQTTLQVQAAHASVCSQYANWLRAHAVQDQLGSDEADDRADEEPIRAYWLARIQLACLQSVDQLQALPQELAMLQHAERLRENGTSGEQAEPRQPVGDLVAQLRLAAGNLERSRQQVAADVLRPSHVLPTRSLREQADIEIRQAQEAAARQAEAEKQPESDEDSDAWTQRQRAKDEWKDDHPTGWGNSKLRPCA